jgi:tellurite methyltransferase
MSDADRKRWDTIYRQQTQFPEPDPFLFEYAPPARHPGQDRALDLAGGMGQNGLWLAQQGYVVDVMDISRLALVRGRGEMVRRSVRDINFLQCDLDDADLKPNRYQVVCVFRYFQRDLFAQLRACVQPGGRLIYETYNVHHLVAAPQFNPELLANPGELASYFADWKILHSSDADQVSRLAAIKPNGS